jgi:CHAT domain
MAPMDYLDSKLQLFGPDRARFSCAGREYVGAVSLGEEVRQRLAALELTPEEYGRELYGAVFPPASPLREGLREAAVAAERERRRLRFRLHLSRDLAPELHALFWELLTDGDRHLALARSPDTAFSRYATVPRELGEAASGTLRLLVVVAAPANAERYGLAAIDRGEVLARLGRTFDPLRGALEVEALDPPATPGRLRQRLVEGGFHLLHFFGHGEARYDDSSSLVLEADDGTARFVGEELLAEVFLGDRGVRLVTLIACHGGAPSSPDSFSGLAGRLVERGLPAVLAMRRAVSFDAAHLFTSHFYRHLAQSGRVDAAVNEARQQLFLADPGGPAWSSPVLYMRLADGLLWRPPSAGAAAGEAPSGAAAAGEAAVPASRLDRPAPSRATWSLRRPLTWMPAGLFALLLLLSRWPAAEAEAKLDLTLSRVEFRLAESSSVVDLFHLDELAATQLAAIEQPPALAAAGQEVIRAGEGQVLSVAVRALGGGDPPAAVTFQPLPLPKGGRVVIEHQGGSDYHFALIESDAAVRVNALGHVSLLRVLAPAAARPASADLHFASPQSLLLYPRDRTLDLDLVFSRFDGGEISPDLAIDRLSLVKVVEENTPGGAVVVERSTLLGGEVHLLASGARHRLEPGEALRFAALAGRVVRLDLGEEGIKLLFQGRVSALELAPAGLGPESLMPSWLDLHVGLLAARLMLGLGAALALGSLALVARQARLSRLSPLASLPVP